MKSKEERNLFKSLDFCHKYKVVDTSTPVQLRRVKEDLKTSDLMIII